VDHSDTDTVRPVTNVKVSTHRKVSTDTKKVGSNIRHSTGNNTSQGVVTINKYSEGSMRKFGMVRSQDTARLPLRSILKTGNTESRKFPGFPPAHSDGSDSALNLAPGPNCSVSSLPSSLPTSQYGVPAPLAGCQDTREVFKKQVSFCSVLQKYSIRGDVSFSKVSIFTPGTLYFREKPSPRFRGRRTSTSSLQAVSSDTSSPGASSQTGPASSQTGPASSQTVPVSSQPDPAAPTARVQSKSHGAAF